MLAMASLSLVFGVWLLASGRVGTEFFPQNDQGFVTISTQAPPGTTLAAHDAAMRQVEQRLMQVPEVKNITASVGRLCNCAYSSRFGFVPGRKCGTDPGGSRLGTSDAG